MGITASQSGWGAAHRVARLGLLIAAAATVLCIRILPLSLAANAEPSQYRYLAEDGQEHVYFVDFDGFLWLRHARNYLRSGTTCDAVIDGECRDTYANAPVGRHMRYARSLHIAAIVGLHQLINRLHPHYPLEASAYWVAVVVGVLGVLPTFAIGRCVGNDVGGFTAAVLIGVHPYVLARTVGCDNDVWNVVLPLYAVWAALVALTASSTLRRVMGAVLAAACVGLHAATWSGWPFTSAVVLATFAADLARRAALLARQVWRGQPPRGGQRGDETLGPALLVLLAFCAATGTFVWLVGVDETYLHLTNALLTRIPGLHGLGEPLMPLPPSDAPSAYWPNALATVAELERVDLRRLAAGAPSDLAYLAIALAGLLSLWLQWARGRRQAGPALLVTIWFAAALLLAREAVRFVLLLVPPTGIACAAAVGWLYAWLTSLVARPAQRIGTALAPLLFVAVSLPALALAVQAAFFASRMVPPVNRAWWDALTHLRDTTPAEAIVDTAWDYGHQTKYIAERRVSSDGAGLLTHTPYWFARALLTQNEREAAGLLRMLNCGSDATPEPEGRFSAYGKLRALGIDDVTALGTIVALSLLDRPAARAFLVSHGLQDAAAEDVLAATHCTPAPSYLVLSNYLSASRLWSLAAWNFQRAYAVNVSRHLPETEAAGDLVHRFGLSPEAARALYRQASELPTDAAVEEFIVPPHEYLMSDWQDCPSSRDCASALLQSQVAGVSPAQVVVAGPEGVRQLTRQAAPDPNLVALVDDVGHRFLLGTRYLLHSTFVQLMYLDGRYAQHFEKFDERLGPNAERVVTWRIREEAREPDRLQ